MPDLTLSDALQEAYASAKGGPICSTLSIYFAGLVDDEGAPSDLFLFDARNPTTVSVDGVRLLAARLEASAPRQASQVVTFIGVPFQITKPDMTTDPMPRAQLVVDNVKQEMIDLVSAASIAGKAIEVTYREYLAGAELDGPQNDPPIVLKLVDVVATPPRITGQLKTLTIGNRRFPFQTYTPDRFRTLQYA